MAQCTKVPRNPLAMHMQKSLRCNPQPLLAIPLLVRLSTQLSSRAHIQAALVRALKRSSPQESLMFFPQSQTLIQKWQARALLHYAQQALK
jgi:hypothetical protein